MTLFEYEDYRTYLRDHISGLPRKGRGEYSKIATHLRVNTTWISQIMAGSQDFNLDQAYALSLYLGHTELETDYFSLLVQKERAATSLMKDYLKTKIKKMKEESLALSKRVRYTKQLTDQERAIFYSSWIYSAIHIFTSLKSEGVTLDEIADRFGLAKVKISEAVQFLTKTGVIEHVDGRYKLGVQSTFVPQGSPHLLKHHSSWRLKAIQRSESLNETELMVTGQYSLSKKDFLKLRERLTEFVKSVNQTVQDTEPEDIVCMNIDWFWLEK